MARSARTIEITLLERAAYEFEKIALFKKKTTTVKNMSSVQKKKKLKSLISLRLLNVYFFSFVFCLTFFFFSETNDIAKIVNGRNSGVNIFSSGWYGETSFQSDCQVCESNYANKRILVFGVALYHEVSYLHLSVHFVFKKKLTFF